MKGSPQSLIDGLGSLASPPAIHQELMRVIARPTSSASDIADVIGRDPALSASLLRLVNSSFFAFSRRIDDLGTAVMAVGVSQIRDLALATSVISLFKDVPADEVSMEDFWKHSLATAVGSRVLASMRQEFNVESLFLAGLLHDLGRLVLFLRAGRMMNRSIREARDRGLPLHQAEAEIFGFHHGDMGQALMERWNLEELFGEVAAYHHAPLQSERFPLETATVHAADVIANLLRWGHSGAPVAPPLSPRAWKLLGLEASGGQGRADPRPPERDRSPVAGRGRRDHPPEQGRLTRLRHRLHLPLHPSRV